MAGSIERRLRKLEPAEEPQSNDWYEVIVDADEIREDALRRQFGDQWPPKGANLIFWQLVEPPPRPEPPAPDPPPSPRREQSGMTELARLLSASRRVL